MCIRGTWRVCRLPDTFKAGAAPEVKTLAWLDVVLMGAITTVTVGYLMLRLPK